MWYQTLIGPVCKPPVAPPHIAPATSKYKSEKQMMQSMANRMKAALAMQASRHAGIEQLKRLCTDWMPTKTLAEQMGRSENNIREMLRSNACFESKAHDLQGGRFKCKLWRVKPTV
jgi:hypothetical protein